MERKFTDDEIAKAMEWCTGGTSDNCRNCPLENEAFCKDTWEEGILDLINRQKAEIERLKSPCEMQIEVSKKIEDTIKAEAIKEFAERLKNAFPLKAKHLYGADIVNRQIDNIVKEITEENNNER